VYGAGYKSPTSSSTTTTTAYSTIDLPDGWRRRVLTYTCGHTGNNYFRGDLRSGTQQGIPDAGDSRILLDNIMLEEKDYYTAFTESSRSVAESIIDLTGLNTVDTTNALWNSSGLYYTSSKIEVADAPHLDGFEAFTFEAWVYPVGTGYRRIYDKNYNTAYNFSISTDDTFYVYINGSAVNAGVTVNEGFWNHLCATYDGATITFYKNGENVHSEAWAAGAVGTSADDLSIGANYTGVTSDFVGEIDVAKIYNRSLTPTEIKQNFNALRSRYGL